MATEICLTKLSFYLCAYRITSVLRYSAIFVRFLFRAVDTVFHYRGAGRRITEYARPINTGNGTCQRYRTPCCDSTRRYRTLRLTNFTTTGNNHPPFADRFDERKSVLNFCL